MVYLILVSEITGTDKVTRNSQVALSCYWLCDSDTEATGAMAGNFLGSQQHPQLPTVCNVVNATLLRVLCKAAWTDDWWRAPA